MADKAPAVRALKATIALDVAAREKLEQVIARKKLQGADVEEERAEVARLNREIADARDALAETEAAQAVVSTPTVDDIRAVTETERAIQALAIKDASTQAGLDFIRRGIAAAGQLRDKVKV